MATTHETVFGTSYKLKVCWTEEYDDDSHSSTVTITGLYAAAASGTDTYAWYAVGKVALSYGANDPTVVMTLDTSGTGQSTFTPLSTAYKPIRQTVPATAAMAVPHAPDGTASVTITLIENSTSRSGFTFFRYGSGNVYRDVATADVSQTIALETHVRGLCHIDNGTALQPCTVWIDTGTDWVQVIPHVDDGTAWAICT